MTQKNHPQIIRFLPHGVNGSCRVGIHGAKIHFLAKMPGNKRKQGKQS